MKCSGVPGSNNGITGAVTSFRTGPGNIIEGILDITGFAMKAVGRVKLDAAAAVYAFVRHDFIHITRAETGTGMPVPGKALVHAQVPVVDDQMRRLVFPVDGLGKIDARQLVHHQHPVMSGRCL